jgi:hypothetical protein
VLGRLWAALGLAGVYSGYVMIGEPPLLVSGLASNYVRIRALLSKRLISDCVTDRSSVQTEKILSGHRLLSLFIVGVATIVRERNVRCCSC